jgi:hypothetical protein
MFKVSHQNIPYLALNNYHSLKSPLISIYTVVCYKATWIVFLAIILLKVTSLIS